MRRFMLAGVLLLTTVIPAQAGWLKSGGPKLPKPISFVQKRGNDAELVAPHLAQRNAKYSKPTWGSDWARVPKQPQRPLRPSLR